MQIPTRPSRPSRSALVSLALLATAACADAGPVGPADAARAGDAVALAQGGEQTPTRQVVPVDVSLVDGQMCGFPVLVEVTGALWISRRRHPGTGLLVEQQVVRDYVVTLSANGKTVSGRNAGVNRIDHDDSDTPTTFTQRGMSAAFTVPGYGVVLLDAGTIVLDAATLTPILERGPHQQFGSAPDRSALCAYLAP